MDGKNRKDIKPGLRVSITQKQDQRTGKLTGGIVKDILTKSAFHSRGIKVRLQTGEVGRVQAIIETGQEVTGRGAEECDDRSLVNPDTAIGLAGHVSDMGQAAFFALALCGRASATADPFQAAPRYLRGPGLGERGAFHHVGDSAHFLSPASRAESIA
jgi:uncharacterized repeat protein (TIGR03833 family)